MGSALSFTIAGWAAFSLPTQLVIVDNIPGTFVDISSTGTALGLGDEGVVDVWPDFDLGQTLFAEGDGRVWVSNNGALGFVVDGGFGAHFNNREIPDLGLFGGGHVRIQSLAVYWDDLAAQTGDVYYETVGAPGDQTFIVQWHERPHYPGDGVIDGNEVTFQAQIFEGSGPIKAQFLYADLDFADPEFDNGASATIGYQAGLSLNNVQWSFDQPDAVAAGDVLTLVEPAAFCDHFGDGNGDCFIDMDDYAEFADCLTGPAIPRLAGCACYDMNQDGRVDLADLAEFQAAFTGPDDPIPGCTP